jgi:hypothetical protein
MANIITRKCAKCKGEIVIDKNNIEDVIFFNKLYYHKSCFKDTAVSKAESKRGKPQMWQDALDSVWELEAETKKMLESYIAKDELNAWLLENYDVVTVPSYFWQLVADLEAGKYRNKKCKPISITTLYPMWRWGQKRLDNIALSNKSNRKGPKNDNDRLRYDLAILISHTEDFKKHQNKIAAMESERQIAAKENIKINYNKIKTVNSDNNGLDDISGLLDELI